MITKTLEKAFNQQIEVEEISSRIYLAMAAWLEGNGLPGAAAFLYRQTNEERMHLHKFIKYLNDRGGKVALQNLPSPENKFKSLKDVFEKVLKHEEFVSASINKLYEICLKEKDFTSGNYLQWFITEQVEEEATMRGILDKIALLGANSSAMYLVDQELASLATTPINPA